MSVLLELKDVCFHYDEKKEAISNINATINNGDVIAILGNNGAGKSTFFKCCNGVLKPSKGEILLKGQQVKTKSDILKLRQSVGLVFQSADNQIIAGTVMDEISFGPMNLDLEKKEVKRRIDDAIQKMNLQGYELRSPNYLSGGEKKLVTIADILAMNPDMILFDEPTASLDPINTKLFRENLERLRDMGMTILVSTHDIDFAYEIADRAIIFSRGNIIADGDIEEIFGDDDIIERSKIRKPHVYELKTFLNKTMNTNISRNTRSLDELMTQMQKFDISHKI